MNLVLIGYRAAGKTTVGRALSVSLGKAFVDTDEMIEERHGSSIGEIVEFYGWDYFRALERRLILEVSGHDDMIIAAGGGAVLDGGNVRDLKRNGFLIWLKADAQVLFERMVRDHRTATGRPSLTGRGLLEEFKEVLVQREGLYKEASEVEVDTSLLDVSGVVTSVLSILEERAVKHSNGRKFVRDAF